MSLNGLITHCAMLADTRQTFPYSIITEIILNPKGQRYPRICLGYREYRYINDLEELSIRERDLMDFLNRLSEIVSLDSEDWTVAGNTIGNILKAGKSITKLAKEIEKGMK